MTQTIQILADKLNMNDIPFELKKDCIGIPNNHLCYPSADNMIISVIYNDYSYGLELLSINPVLHKNYTTIDEVYNFINNDWKYRKNHERTNYKIKRIRKIFI